MAQNFPIAPTTIPDQFAVPKPSVPESVKKINIQPNVTNYYDSLLKVEGNVDKNALPELKVLLEKSFKYTSKKLYQESIKRGAQRPSR